MLAKLTEGHQDTRLPECGYQNIRVSGPKHSICLVISDIPIF
jgi:hypothetical protein